MVFELGARPEYAARAGRDQGGFQIGEGEALEGAEDVQPARPHAAIVSRRPEVLRALAQEAPNALVVEFRVGAQQDGCGAAHVGSRHGGAGSACIALAHREGGRARIRRGAQGEDIAPAHVDVGVGRGTAPGRRQVDHPSVVGKTLRGAVVLSRRGHGNHSSRVLRAIGNDIEAPIARRGDHHDSHGLDRAHDLFGEGISRAQGAARPTRIHHPGPVAGGIEDRAPEIRIQAVAFGGKSLEGHDTGARCHADDPLAVIRHRRDGARYVGPVAAVVEGVWVAMVKGAVVEAVLVAVDGVGEVEASQVVDEAVGIVVDPVPVAGVDPAVAVEVLARIDPDVVRDIRVVVVEPGVHHGHHHALAGGERPGLGAPHAVQPPEVVEGLVPTPRGVEEGIVGEVFLAGRGGKLVEGLGVVDLHPRDVGIFGVEGQGSFGRDVPPRLDEIDMRQVGQGPWRRGPAALGPALEGPVQPGALIGHGSSIGSPKEGAYAPNTRARVEGVQGARPVPGLGREGPSLGEEGFRAVLQGVGAPVVEFDDELPPAPIGAG